MDERDLGTSPVPSALIRVLRGASGDSGKIATTRMNLNAANTILYCGRWEETVRFYRDGLRLPVVFAADWFVEFRLAADSRLSIADDARATVKSSGGAGITLSLQVEDIRAEHEHAERVGLKPTAIREHPWQAETFHLFDPEGHRIEIWQPTR